MLSDHQDAEPPIMFRPSPPTSATTHVLHRQPRISSLNTQRASDKDLILLEWLPKDIRDGRAQHTSSIPNPIDYGWRSTARHYPPDEKGIDRAPRDTTVWDPIADLYHDVPGSIQAVSSEGAKHSPAPHATPRLWESSSASTCVRRSLEWETETLLNHNSSELEVDMVAHPCPFRKRNPGRFNIRDHETCARAPFDSILGLRAHIVGHHRRNPSRHQCRRCKDQFDTELALEEHLLLPRDQVCEVNLPTLDDPEDGITEEMARMLAVKDAPTGAWTWEAIWRLVFPSDAQVPDPDLHPVVELAEIQQAFDDTQEVLKDSLREKLHLLLPQTIDDNYLGFLTGQIELVFETHRSHIMKNALTRSATPTSPQQQAFNHPPQTQQPTDPPRKPNRASRRNTLLQSLHRAPAALNPDATSPPRLRRQSIRTTTTSRHTSLLLSDNPRPPVIIHHHPYHHKHSASLSNRPTHPAADGNRQHAISHHHGGPHTPVVPARFTGDGSGANNNNPRDSCDSGIGMLCELCGGGVDGVGGGDSDGVGVGVQACRCGDGHGGRNRGWGQQMNIKADGLPGGLIEPGLGEDEDGSHPGGGGGRLGLALRIRTEDVCIGDRDFGREDGEEIAAGRFSPESFKQRVLRKGFLVG